MKPRIGVLLKYNKLEDGRPILYIGEKVRRTLQMANADVFAIMPTQDVDYINTKGNEFPELTIEEKEIINKNLDSCDGLFLPGGFKFTPFDRYVLNYAIEKHIPTLGVCLSMQMMNCYNEDIELIKNDTSLNHFQEDDNELSHKIKIKKNSKLYKILETDEIIVNSFHKYHSTKNCIYEVTATSEDGIIEGIEYPGDFFNVGVQWHPEISYNFDENSKKIIDTFINEASKFNIEKSKLNSVKIR